jgi:membrane-associated phospholipid phosphatase
MTCMNQTNFQGIPFFWRFGVPLLALSLFLITWVFGFNTPLFYWINSWHVMANSTFWAGLTSMGDTAITLPLTLVFLRYMPTVFPPMLITTLTTPIILHTIKNLADAGRPGAIISPVDFYFVEPLYTAHSFPSGHTTTIFAWACVIILQMQPSTQKFWGYILLAFTFITGLSRIIVGAHWPVDIFFGAALGWSMSVLATWLAIKWSWLHSQTAQKWSIGFFIMMTLISLFFIDIDYKMVNSWHRVLMVFCLMFALFPWIDKTLKRISQFKL